MIEIKAAPQNGETPWARLDRAFRTVIKVPKEALLKEEAKLKRQKLRKRARKTA
jgi:hypothetical protein